jgi:hypothetical protein
VERRIRNFEEDMMSTISQRHAPAFADSTAHSVWFGRILSGLAIAFLVTDGTMKLVRPQAVIDATLELGWSTDAQTLTLLGIVLLTGTILYAIPKTAVLGAIVLTGYLGGAVAAHVRVGDPLLTHDLFGVYLGLLIWGGLWLRDARVRALISLSPELR